MSLHLVLIDALNLIRRIYAVQERPFLLNNELAENTKQQVLSNTETACSSALTKILDQHQPTHALAVFDSATPCWRYQLFPDYKKGRKKMPEHLMEYLANIQDAFMEYGVDSLISEEDEADDIIATLAVKVALHGGKVTIISTDKGYLPLLNNHIHIYDYFNRRYLDKAYVQNKFSVQPRQLIDLWSLIGDNTNKIPGVSGIGQITAAKLLNEYGSITALLQADNVKATTSKALHDAKTQLKLNQKLLQLKQDIPLGFNLKDIRLQPEKE